MTDYSVKRYNQYSDKELIAGLCKYAKERDLSFISCRDFSSYVGISESTITNHFGSWSAFCRKAGLNPRYDRAANRHELLENLGRAWEVLGRQPRAKEIKQPLSPISISRYQKEFRTGWYQICLEFLSWKSGLPVSEIEIQVKPIPITGLERIPARTTRRGIPLSLRYDVLKRDRFRCIKCGCSPAIDVGIQLHIDHIVPWAKGGETVLENLQSLCSECNLGKSDRPNE